MEMSDARGAREYAKFRQTKHGRTAVGIVNDDEARIETLQVNAIGNTEILPAQGETANYNIKGFHLSNADSSTVIISLRAGSGGQKLFTTMLAASGGNLDKNLVGRYWRLPLNKPLVVNLASAGDVWVTVEYEIEGEPAEEAVTPTDTLSIAEGITSIDVVKAVTDAQTFAESLVKTITLNLSDTLTIAESLANATTLSISDALVITESETEGTGVGGLADAITFAESLITGTGKVVSDTQSIAEAVANAITLSLSDSIAIDDGDLVIVHGT